MTRRQLENLLVMSDRVDEGGWTENNQKGILCSGINCEYCPMRVNVCVDSQHIERRVMAVRLEMKDALDALRVIRRDEAVVAGLCGKGELSVTGLELTRRVNLVKMFERLRRGEGKGSRSNICTGMRCWECPFGERRCPEDYEEFEELLCESYRRQVVMVAQAREKN